MYSSLLVEIEKDIAIITVNRPDKLNALNKTVIEELSAAIDEVINNSTIRSAVLTGSGAKAFVAGADISEFSTLDAAGGKALAGGLRALEKGGAPAHYALAVALGRGFSGLAPRMLGHEPQVPGRGVRHSRRRARF
ncbi:MAG: hypothetical protein EOO01_35075, partial [Chitinophagaceae bacterium]